MLLGLLERKDDSCSHVLHRSSHAMQGVTDSVQRCTEAGAVTIHAAMLCSRMLEAALIVR